MLKLEVRPPSKLMSTASPLLALAITVVIGIVLFTLLGKDPMKGLYVFFVEPVKSLYALSELSVKATPLILIALGLAVCFRSNVWNIGAEGQFVVGALCAGWVAMQATPDMGRWIVVPILLAGVLGGMLWAGIVALLRDRFNANEILVSLMLVYVAGMVLSYLVYGPWKDPRGYNFPQTITFLASTKIPRLVAAAREHRRRDRARRGGGLLDLPVPHVSRLPIAGRRARADGRALRRLLVARRVVDRAAAVGRHGGPCRWSRGGRPLGQLTPYVPAGYGFAAIIVAFVGRLHPVGIIFSALLMSMFYIGGELAQSRLGLPKSLTGVFQGLLLFALLACDTLIHYRVRWSAAPAQPPVAKPAAPQIKQA